MVVAHRESPRAARFVDIVGEDLREAIHESELTITGIALAVGIERATLSRYLNGTRVLPLSTYIDICEAVAIDPHAIIDQAYDRLISELGPPEPSSVPRAVRVVMPRSPRPPG